MAEGGTEGSRPQICPKALVAALGLAQADQDPSKNPPSEILAGALFLGDCDNATNSAQLSHFGISHVLNVTTHDSLGEQQEGIQRLFLRAQDWEEEPIAAHFPAAYSFIDSARSSGGCVLVHCMAGRSRSAAIVIAYLMRAERMPLEDAYLFVKRRRPIVQPNVGFWEQLMAEELKHFPTSSPVPQAYAWLLELRRTRSAEGSPAALFAQYLAAFLMEASEYAEEQQARLVDGWPAGWPVANAVEEILLASVEELNVRSRQAAVCFVARLLQAGKFAAPEVGEGFRQFQGADFEELRIDNPRVDEYVAEILGEAARQGVYRTS